MSRIYKVLSALLSYPTAEMVEAAPAMRAAVKDAAELPSNGRRALLNFIDELAAGDLIDMQERYVMLFDRTRSLSLHLFEHVWGESRDRGQAMVDLGLLYERHGLDLSARELPDYLPLFLEFLSTLPADEARALLAEPVDVLATLHQRHRKRGTVYAPVFQVLEALAATEPNELVVAELLSQPEDDPDDLEALDEIWEEEAVRFGPDSAGQGIESRGPACGGERPDGNPVN